MASVFEIVKKLRNEEEVIINKRYQFILMQQMDAHKIGDIVVNFEPHGKNRVRVTLGQ